MGKEAGLPERCRLLGLKKGVMRRLAEAGNTAHELTGISRHRTVSDRRRRKNFNREMEGAPRLQSGDPALTRRCV
jgi:hypothetical protein